MVGKVFLDTNIPIDAYDSDAGRGETPLIEDLNHVQIIEGIRIENPFKT